MAIDKDFIENFEKQRDLLKSLEQAVHDAIVRADERIKAMKKGKSMEEVFGPVPPKQ
jgi:hypothetical protein